MSDWKLIEDKLRGLLSGEFSSLSLSFNDIQAPNYETAKQFFVEGEQLDSDWTSPEERGAALRDNSVWRLQWYPHTPVGFNCYQASSLEAIFEALEADPPNNPQAR